ncbi:DNA (cytosine-5-)-methyltransferase [Pedobacter changchengzhani]|uniref:Cytosine-specific methyltransferase n=1 Tax=Pedobacter changchengzhani TaxID=2529274 RepID=A0A4R5MIY7_9SPHI|nr:DNA (cytosine-5-)-methyltransferase [Pedobacter changchengzhani]TDG35346.1 DNA (cytosine-5-)-methyltransferase [Pedobacter changchengzhani]
MSKKFKVGSLYAGVGGVCQGFINAGMELAWANEIDKFACVTYRNNFNHTLYENDIFELEPNKLSPIDILTGGFPCQPFSIAGYRKGFEDKRGNHFFRIIQYAKVLKPKAMLLENVKNLMSHDKGNTFKVIIETLEAMNYSVFTSVLNSKAFGNIPQNRERIYIVAFLKDENHIDIYGQYFKFPEPIKLNVKIEDLIEDIEVAPRYYYGKDKAIYNELAQHITSTETVYQWRRHYVRENKQNVCPTLTANMGTGGHNVPLILTKSGIRKLMPQECFSFQGFPEAFVLPDISQAQLYKQAGNSVTVPVIKRIAENIKNALLQIGVKD